MKIYEGTENQLEDSYMIVIKEWKEQCVGVWIGMVTICFCRGMKRKNMQTYHIASFRINIGCLAWLEWRKLLFSVKQLHQAIWENWPHFHNGNYYGVFCIHAYKSIYEKYVINTQAAGAAVAISFQNAHIHAKCVWVRVCVCVYGVATNINTIFWQ